MFMCVVNRKSVNKLDLTLKQSFLIPQSHSNKLKYTHIHPNTLKYTQIHSNTLKYTHNTPIHSHTLTYTHIHLHILYVNVMCVFECIWVFLSAFECYRVYVSTYIHLHSHTLKYTYIHIHSNILKYTDIHWHTQ